MKGMKQGPTQGYAHIQLSGSSAAISVMGTDKHLMSVGTVGHSARHRGLADANTQ